MAANNRGVEYADLWRMYKEQDNYKDAWAETHRAQILHWINLPKNLPVLSYKAQLEVLDNCPMDIVKAHAHLLHAKAKKALGLEGEEKPAYSKGVGEWFDILNANRNLT